MTLTLTIEGADGLETELPARLELDRHGAMIGRSPHADWSLPDPRNLVSSRHCEISYRDGQYLLIDHSTNGTYLNDATAPLRGAHVLANGDRFRLGHYAVTVKQSDATAKSAPSAAIVDVDGWDSFSETEPEIGPIADERWADPVGSIGSIEDAGARWRSGSVPLSAADRHAGTWDLPAPVARPSSWSSEPSAASGPTANDVWGRLSEGNEIDWSRGDFAATTPLDGDWRPAANGGDVTSGDHAEAGPREVDDERAYPGSEQAAGPSAAAAVPSDAWAKFVTVSGLPADRLNRAPGEVLVAAGAVLRQLVSGLMLMIDARARAKAQLGVQATGLELDGNNPLKFVRSPERALLQLLDATERGFMPADRAVEDAFQDLQAHQMATLSAMRGALKGTLTRFSPDTFRNRFGEARGLARWFPILHRARHWDAYVHDFEGVVRGADDAFMDVYAKEFRLHYDRHIDDMKQRQRDHAD